MRPLGWGPPLWGGLQPRQRPQIGAGCPRPRGNPTGGRDGADPGSWRAQGALGPFWAGMFDSGDGLCESPHGPRSISWSSPRRTRCTPPPAGRSGGQAPLGSSPISDPSRPRPAPPLVRGSPGRCAEPVRPRAPPFETQLPSGPLRAAPRPAVVDAAPGPCPSLEGSNDRARATSVGALQR